MRGYVLFEDPKIGEAPQFIEGEKFARALRGGCVAVLIMNACRSAYTSAEETTVGSPAGPSLAHEIAKNGAPAVVAMRYNVDVSTAASFMACLYEFLVNSNDLGEAFTSALRRLDERSADMQIPEAWQLPLLVEKSSVKLRFIRTPPHIAESRSALIVEDGLPPSPLTGILGQDLALLLLDRFLSSNSAAAILGAPGSGKRRPLASLRAGSQGVAD